MTARLPPIWHAAALRPLAPLVLAAWEDGSLTPGELLDLRSALERSAAQVRQALAQIQPSH